MIQTQAQARAVAIPFAGQWSPFREAGRCPCCGAWVKVGRKGKTMPPVGAARVRYLYCECGEAFKVVEVDETFTS